MGVVKGASGSSAENAGRPSSKVCPTCGAKFSQEALFCANDGTPLTSGDPAAASADAYVGQSIAGHIEVRSLAGSGAMGRVYRAFQKGVDRDVAVKILHRELSANQQLVQRFHREAKVASRLQHPNVVHVHLVGQLQDGAMYIVMEYLDGMSLQAALNAAGGAFDLTRTMHVALQLCDAVGEAHAQGVVHRDLKPENVMLVRRGGDPDFVKVLDFGIARLNWGEQSMATAAGLIFGTARYISPEGAQGEAVGPAGDVYAIATLLYQMLAGRTPFEGEQAVALLVQQIHQPPPPLRSVERASYVPEPIARAIMANLAKDPNARDADARLFGQALMDAIRRSGLSVEDVAARHLMLSPRASAVSLAPLEKTGKMPMQPDVQKQLATAPLPVQSEPRMPVRASLPSVPAGHVGAPAGPRPSGVEVTVDDLPPAPPPAYAHSPSAPVFERTQAVQPIPEALGMQVAPAVAPTGPFHSPEAIDATIPKPAPSAPNDLGRARRLSKYKPPTDPRPVDDVPPSSEEPISEIPGVGSERNRRVRMIAIVILCFLVGATGSVFLAKHFGVVGAESDDKLVDKEVERANRAIIEERWNSPPGDNVVDITDEGLRKWPNDPKLVEVRKHAARELVEGAGAKLYQGDAATATRLLLIAKQLDPSNADVQPMLDRAAAGTDAGVPPAKADAGAGPRPTTTVANTGTAGFVPAVAPRATIETNPPKPHPGQAVEIVVKLFGPNNTAPKTAPGDSIVTVTGPNVPAGTRIPVIPDGTNVVRGGLTFFEAGRYDIAFSGKVDGVAVKATGSVVVAAAAAPGPPDAAPTASGKWL
jgi:serine/threonine-protein kinase